MKNIKDVILNEAGKDYSDYKEEVADQLYNIYYNQGLKRFVNAMIHFIEDGHYTKTGWESDELKKLLPKLKSLRQKPKGFKSR